MEERKTPLNEVTDAINVLSFLVPLAQAAIGAIS